MDELIQAGADELSSLWDALFGKTPDYSAARAFYGDSFDAMLEFHKSGYRVDPLPPPPKD